MTILAYAVELTGAANGTVQGNLYELDYQQHFQHIRDAALPVGANRLIYERLWEQSCFVEICACRS